MGMAAIALMVHAAVLQSLFTIEVQPRVAAEGGPIVLDVTVTYIGAKPIELYLFGDKHFSIEPPASWRLIAREQQPKLFYFGFLPDTTTPLRFGEKVRHTFLVHRLFAGKMPAGPATFTVRFNAGCQIIDGQPFVIAMQKTVGINIEPFTKEFANKLHQQFVNNKQEPFVLNSAQYPFGYADIVLDCCHPEFVPLALGMVEKNVSQTYQLREYIWNTCPDPSSIHNEFVNDLLSIAPKYTVCRSFDDWRRREIPPVDNLRHSFRCFGLAGKQLWCEARRGEPVRIPYIAASASRTFARTFQQLPDPLVKKLQKEGDLLTKTMVYVTFPRRVAPCWSDNVLKELTDRVRPIPENQFNNWLSELDSDDFRVRQSAGKSLLANFDRAKSMLLKANAQTLSAEASESVKKILERGSQLQRDPMEQELLRVLRDNPSTEDMTVLKILASGDPECPLTKEARNFLERKKIGP